MKKATHADEGARTVTTEDPTRIRLGLTRRRLLEGVAVAGGLWILPAVESFAPDAAAGSVIHATTNGILVVAVSFTSLSAGGESFLLFDVASGTCAPPSATTEICGIPAAPVGPQLTCTEVGATLTSDATGVTVSVGSGSGFAALGGFVVDTVTTQNYCAVGTLLSTSTETSVFFSAV